MPNPRTDLTSQQYEQLRQMGLSDGTIGRLTERDLGVYLPTPQPAAAAPPPAPEPLPEPEMHRPQRSPRVGGAQAEFVAAESRRGPESRDRALELSTAARRQVYSPGGEPLPLQSGVLREIEQRALGQEQRQEQGAASRILQVSRGEATDVGAGGLADIAGAMVPQRVASAEQAADRERQRLAEARAAVKVVEREVALGQHPGVTLDNMYDADRQEQVTTLVRDRQRRLAAGGLEASDFEAALAAGANVLEDITTKPMRSGELVESTPMWLLRVLSAPTSGLVGALDPTTSVAERIKGGEGLVGGGRDAAEALAKAAGADEGSVRYAGYAGGMLGFVGELMVPGDLGLSAGARAAGKALRSYRLATEAGASVGDAARVSARRALIPDKYNTANTRLTELYASNPRVQEVADDALEAAVSGGIRDLDDVAASPRMKGRYADGEEMLDEFVDAGILTSGERYRILDTKLPIRELARTLQPLVKAGERAAKGVDGWATLNAKQQRQAVKAAQAETLASQAGRNVIRARNLAAEEVRLTPSLVAEPGVARKVFRDYQGEPLAQMSLTLAQDSKPYLNSNGTIDVDKLAKAAGVDLTGPAGDALRAAGPLDQMPVESFSRTSLEAFQDYALNNAPPASIRQIRAAPQAPPPAASGAPPMSVEPLVAPQLTKAAARRAVQPQQVRPGRLRQWLRTNIGSLEESYPYVDPAMEPMVREVAERWGSIERDLWQQMRQGTGSRAQRFVGAVYDAYDSPDQLVADVIANMYGGFERMAQLVFMSGGSAQADKLLAEPASIRAAVRAMLNGLVEGRIPQALAKDPGKLSALTQLAAKLRAPNPDEVFEGLVGVLRELQDVPLSKLGATFKNADKVRPIFDMGQVPDLLAASYHQRRAGQVLDEVFTPEALLDATGSPYGNRAKDVVDRLADSVNGVLEQLGQRPLTTEDVVLLLARATGEGATYRIAQNVIPLNSLGTRGLSDELWAMLKVRGYDDNTSQGVALAIKNFVANGSSNAPHIANYNEAISQYLQLFLKGQHGGPRQALMALGVNENTVSRLIANLDTKTLSDIIKGMEKQAPKNNRWWLRLWDSFLGFYGPAQRWGKGGLLSGRIGINFPYMGVNFLTAPSIIMQTLGPRSALRAAGRLSMMDFNLNSAIKRYYGVGDGMNIVARSPTGEVYTASQVAEALNRVSTQSGFELNEEALRSIRAWSGISGRRLAAGAETIGAAEQSALRRGARMWTGIDPDAGAADIGVEMNLANEMSQAQDLYFRAGVLLDALKNGQPLDEAVRLANEALFNYANTSARERQVLGKVFWFWSFRRESYRTLLINMLESPQRVRATYQGTQMFHDDSKGHAVTKDYLSLRPVWAWMEDPETRRRWAVFGPSTPMLDAFSELADMGTLAALVASDQLYMLMEVDNDPTLMRTARTGSPDDSLLELLGKGAERGTQGKVRRVQQTMRSLLAEANPMIQFLMSGILGVVVEKEGTRNVGTWVDPRWLAFMHTFGMFDTLNSVVGLEKVPPSDINPEKGCFRGHQWRVASDDYSRTAWPTFVYAMLAAGVGRTLRDYSPTIYQMMEEGEEVLPVQLDPDYMDSDALDQILRQTGMWTPAELPTVRERQIGAERDLEYQLRGATR